jgi:hypothetical protein
MSSYYRSILNVQAVALDPDAEAFLTATGITDATITSAINTLVLDLKSDGIWTKMKAIYPIVGGTAFTHKFNLKDPRDLDAAFRLEFFGGITHSANGMQGNETNGYANTHLNFATQFPSNSASMGYYSRTNDTAPVVVEMGVSVSSPAFNFAHIRAAVNTLLGELIIANYSTTSDSRGFWSVSRTSSTSLKSYLNGSLQNTNTSTLAGSLVNLNCFLMARNDAGSPAVFSNKQVAFSYLSDGLTDTETSNLNTAVQALQTTLSRNV